MIERMFMTEWIEGQDYSDRCANDGLLAIERHIASELADAEIISVRRETYHRQYKVGDGLNATFSLKIGALTVVVRGIERTQRMLTRVM